MKCHDFKNEKYQNQQAYLSGGYTLKALGDYCVNIVGKIRWSTANRSLAH